MSKRITTNYTPAKRPLASNETLTVNYVPVNIRPLTELEEKELLKANGMDNMEDFMEKCYRLAPKSRKW